MRFGQFNIKILLLVVIVIIIIGIWCSTKLRKGYEEMFVDVNYPNITSLKYKKLREPCSAEDFNDENIISTLTANNANIENCLTKCNENDDCQSVNFNNGTNPTCDLYNEKCYNMKTSKDYNSNKDCANDSSCSYNKDNVISNQFLRMTRTDNRFIKARQFCSLDDENLGNIIPQGDNEEEEVDVPTVTDCIEKCADISECNSIHIKNYGDTSKKNMKCRLYTGKCLNPTDFYNNNCNEELCSYNKYPCGQFEVREIQMDGLSKYKIYCNNFLFDNTIYNDEASCQEVIDREKIKPENERKICPINCSNEAKLYKDIMLEIEPNNVLLNSLSFV